MASKIYTPIFPKIKIRKKKIILNYELKIYKNFITN